MSAHDTPEVGSGETVGERYRCDSICDAASGGSCFTPWCRCSCHKARREAAHTPASPDPVQPAGAGGGLNTPPPAAGDVEQDIWWGYLCPALANIGALKDAQQEFVALGTDWTEAGRILSRVQRFYVDAAHDAARRYDAAREAAWAEKYAAVAGERDTAEQEREDWRYCAEGLAARAESVEAALATALREKAEDRARVEAVEALADEWDATPEPPSEDYEGTYDGHVAFGEWLATTCNARDLRAALAIPTPAHRHAPGIWCDDCPDADEKREATR